MIFLRILIFSLTLNLLASAAPFSESIEKGDVIKVNHDIRISGALDKPIFQFNFKFKRPEVAANCYLLFKQPITKKKQVILKKGEQLIIKSVVSQDSKSTKKAYQKITFDHSAIDELACSPKYIDIVSSGGNSKGQPINFYHESLSYTDLISSLHFNGLELI